MLVCFLGSKQIVSLASEIGKIITLVLLDILASEQAMQKATPLLKEGCL